MLLKGHRKKEWPPLLQSYRTLKDVMPAVVTSIPNEDPLVVKLLNEFTAVVTNTARRFPVNIEVSAISVFRIFAWVGVSPPLLTKSCADFSADT